MERLGLGLIAAEARRTLTSFGPRHGAPGRDPEIGSIMMTRVMAGDVATPYGKTRHAYGDAASCEPDATSIGHFVTTLKMKGHK